MVVGHTFIWRAAWFESGVNDCLTPSMSKALSVVKPMNASHRTPIKVAEKIFTQAGPPSSPPIPLLRRRSKTKPRSVMKANRRAAKLMSAVEVSPIYRLLSFWTVYWSLRPRPIVLFSTILLAFLIVAIVHGRPRPRKILTALAAAMYPRAGSALVVLVDSAAN